MDEIASKSGRVAMPLAFLIVLGVLKQPHKHANALCDARSDFWTKVLTEEATTASAAGRSSRVISLDTLMNRLPVDREASSLDVDSVDCSRAVRTRRRLRLATGRPCVWEPEGDADPGICWECLGLVQQVKVDLGKAQLPNLGALRSVKKPVGTLKLR